LGDSSRINRRWEYTEDELTKRPINVQDTQTRTQPINPPRTNPQPRIDTASIFPPRPNPQPRVDTPVVVRPMPVPPRSNPQPRVDTPVVVRPTPVPPRPNPQPQVDTPIVVRPIPVPPKPNPSPKTTERIHVVQSGDSLSKIARQYNVTVVAIRQANRLSSDNIRIGQKLIIP
jgi:LysM repeat protein